MDDHERQVADAFVQNWKGKKANDDMALNNLKRSAGQELRRMYDFINELCSQTNSNSFGNAELKPCKITYNLALRTTEARFDIGINGKECYINYKSGIEKMTLNDASFPSGGTESPFIYIKDTFETWLKKESVSETLG